MRLQAKVAIVTGSGSGLGRAMITRLAEEGASVVVADINDKAMDSVVGELQSAGHQAMGVHVDVTKPEQVKALMTTVNAKLGRIDILINNAGITRHRPFRTMSDEDWDLVLGIDLKGVFFCAQAVADIMIQQRYGKIINISSNSGNGGSPHATAGSAAGNANYAAAKAGVIQLTKPLAAELGPHGINVNAIAPGFILTPLTATTRSPAEIAEHIEVRKRATVLRRTGTPVDVANVAVFLASDESSFMAGQVLCVDGGRTDKM